MLAKYIVVYQPFYDDLNNFQTFSFEIYYINRLLFFHRKTGSTIIDWGEHTLALFGRNNFDELDNDYIPLEEFAPTLSKQEVIKRQKLYDLIEPIRDIPLALHGRRDQIEDDLSSFCIDQDNDFQDVVDSFDDMYHKQEGHIADVQTLHQAMEQVRIATDLLGDAISSEPVPPSQDEYATDVAIPQIDLPKLSNEYMPEQELVEQIRGYSSFSHILKKSVDYALSSIDQYHAQVLKLSEQKESLSELAAKADLLALNTTIEATHMDDDSKEFSTKVAGDISDLSRKIHEISAALDAELDILENGFKTVRSSINTIESAHRDCIKYTDMYSAASNEYYRQSTNYTNILISSLSALNKEFRDALDKKDAATADYLKAFDNFCQKIRESYSHIASRNDGVKSVMDGCIRGSASLSDEMAETMSQIKDVRNSLTSIRKTDEVRKSKYSAALLKAFDQDLIWLGNKIESTLEKAEKEEI